MADLEPHIVLTPLRRDRKRLAAGEPVMLTADEGAALRACGAVERDPEAATGGTAFDLGEALADLMAEGHDIASMTMKDIQALLGSNGKGVRRAQVDAALDMIKADDKTATEAETARVAAIVDAIDRLGPEARDENGAVDPAAVRGAFPHDDPPSDAAIAAAVAAIALTEEGKG